MSALGEAIRQSMTADQTFPSSRDHSARFGWSWLTSLVKRRDGAGAPAAEFSQAWDVAANEAFVRRKQSELLNPLLAEQSGNGWPTTHFAGLAGVGRDAERLPITDRRAGIFGVDRRTRLDDVTDGLSHTGMVTGITTDLGSWADPGRATLRSVSQLPYVNGPDGLGTGQPDGMFWLMADGRVQWMSRETDPLLIRRWAAMADGWPLDPTIPGEPGDRPPKASEQEPLMPLLANDRPDPNAVPGDVDAVPAAVVVKPWERLWNQRLLQFEQATPVPRRELLWTVEDLLGVTLELPTSPVWDQPITLRLSSVTVRQLLTAILDGSGFVAEQQGDRVVLLPKPSP
jgi:hypothetical protein